jgi:hypothetical protein
MATGGRNAGFQERDALQLYDEDLALVALQQSQPDPELMLGADYSELGPSGSIACYAVTAYRANQAKDLGLALSRAIQKHLPLIHRDDMPEIHLTDIWSGNRREKTAFAPLKTKSQMTAFLLELAKNVRKVVPYSAVAARSKVAGEAKSYRAPELLLEAIAQLNIWLSLDRRVIIDNATIEVDQGDGVRLMRVTEKGGIGKGMGREFMPGWRLVSDPSGCGSWNGLGRSAATGPSSTRARSASGSRSWSR